jgi:hypothetical protein
MRTWVQRSLNVGALTAGALLAGSAATGAAHAGPTLITSDNVGIGNGTQVFAPIQAPVNVCGNAVAVAGAANAGCEGGASALNPEWRFDRFTMVSDDNVGIGNGTQVFAPVQAPVNVCGNAVAVGGAANAGCEGGATAGPGKPHKRHHGYDKDHGRRHKDHGRGHGHGDYRYEPEGRDVVVVNDGDTTIVSSDNTGVLNGTQLVAPVQIPVNVCGNAIAVLGSANAGCEGGAKAILGL